jgi:hypothetical protein
LVSPSCYHVDRISQNIFSSDVSKPPLLFQKTLFQKSIKTTFCLSKEISSDFSSKKKSKPLYLLLFFCEEKRSKKKDSQLELLLFFRKNSPFQINGVPPNKCVFLLFKIVDLCIHNIFDGF